jgi:4-diphosphocytidyl-2-C-methyl-D-erythritol kinase
MLVFSNCKINIGLRITERRTDGYHNIESVFFPVPWYDALEIIESPALTLHVSGLDIPGETQNNLCIRAWQLLKKDFPQLPPVDIFLHKTIPAGAGIGGGSSNGSFMLKMLNEKFSLGLNMEQLAAYALQLGSDCPFFILNTPAIARQRGEHLTPVKLNLSGMTLVLVNPGIHVHTGHAFAQLRPSYPEKPIEDLIQLPVEQWSAAGISNDFEVPVFNQYPEIFFLKTKLQEAGAVFASMTGTGSTCYGLFLNPPTLSAENFPPNYFVKQFSI